MLAIRSGFDLCETSLLSNYPKRPAPIVFCAERITVDAREKELTGFMMPYIQGELQAQVGRWGRSGGALSAIEQRPRCRLQRRRRHFLARFAVSSQSVL